MKNLIYLLSLLLVSGACSHRPDVESIVSFSMWRNWENDTLPDFTALGQPDTTGEFKEFCIEVHDNFIANHYAALFNAELEVTDGGEYVFFLNADDAARMYVDDKLQIEAGGRKAELFLDKGVHRFRIEFFQGGDWQRLNLHLGRKGEYPHPWGGDGPEEGIPAFVPEQAREAFIRYSEWKGNDLTVVFPILTDIHTEERYSYQHIGFVAATDEFFDYDFMACLGDIGINIGPGHVSKDYTRQVIDLTRAEMDKFNGVFLYAAGNHDWDAGEGSFHTPDFLSETFQKPSLKYAGGNLHLVPGQVYCHYDIPEKNVRVIMLNSEGTGTQNGAYYVYDDSQVEWLKNLLDDTDPETSVVIMSHYMPHPVGRWHNTPEDVTLGSNERMMNLLADYGTRRRIVGLFCGDSHFNAHEVKDGVNYYITQSYGWCTESLMMPGTKHAYFDYRESLCCDIIALKPEKRQVHTFRMGAGGSEYDYEFTY